MVLQKKDPPIRVPFPLNNPISPLPSAPPPPGTPPGSPPAPGKKRIGPAQPRVGSLPKIEVSGTLSVLRCSGKNTKNKTLQNNYRNNYRNNYNQLQTATERITANNYKKKQKTKKHLVEHVPHENQTPYMANHFLLQSSWTWATSISIEGGPQRFLRLRLSFSPSFSMPTHS